MTRSGVIAIIVLLLFGFNSAAQKISRVDFDEVRDVTSDSTSSFFYKYLLEKIENFDGYISPEEYHYLYYGNAFQEVYDPYGAHELEEDFEKLLERKKYRAAADIAREILKQNPVNLAYTYHMLACYHELGIADTARIYAERYYSMIDAIAMSGDGLSPETAFVVLKVNDQYQLLHDMQRLSKGSSLTHTKWGPIDRHDLAEGKAEAENNKEVKEIYFNVSIPFDYMKGMFVTEED